MNSPNEYNPVSKNNHRETIESPKSLDDTLGLAAKMQIYRESLNVPHINSRGQIIIL